MRKTFSGIKRMKHFVTKDHVMEDYGVSLWTVQLFSSFYVALCNVALRCVVIVLVWFPRFWVKVMQWSTAVWKLEASPTPATSMLPSTKPTKEKKPLMCVTHFRELTYYFLLANIVHGVYFCWAFAFVIQMLFSVKFHIWSWCSHTERTLASPCYILTFYYSCVAFLWFFFFFPSIARTYLCKMLFFPSRERSRLTNTM